MSSDHYDKSFDGRLDVYRICRLYDVKDPAIYHAIKKLLRSGDGNKTKAEDIREAGTSIERWIEMEEEDNSMDQSKASDPKERLLNEIEAVSIDDQRLRYLLWGLFKEDYLLWEDIDKVLDKRIGDREAAVVLDNADRWFRIIRRARCSIALKNMSKDMREKVINDLNGVFKNEDIRTINPESSSLARVEEWVFNIDSDPLNYLDAIIENKFKTIDEAVESGAEDYKEEMLSKIDDGDLSEEEKRDLLYDILFNMQGHKEFIKDILKREVWDINWLCNHAHEEVIDKLLEKVKELNFPLNFTVSKTGEEDEEKDLAKTIHDLNPVERQSLIHKTSTHEHISDYPSFTGGTLRQIKGWIDEMTNAQRDRVKDIVLEIKKQ